MMDVASHNLLGLLRVSMGCAGSLDRALTGDEWDAVVKEASKQSVLGMAFKGAMALPPEQLPLIGPKVTMGLAAEKIAKMNALVDERARAVTEAVSELGLRSCVLKGQAVAMLYPSPGSRQCGDIDLWVEGPWRDVLRKIGSRYRVEEVYYHHAGIHPFGPKKTEVEVHFVPSWMNCPAHNRKLRGWFRAMAPEQFANLVEDKGFYVATNSFDCVFSAVHIYRHLLLEGVGLRQIMDYWYILSASSASGREKAYTLLSGLGMKRFLGALMYVEQEFFALDERFLLCPADQQYGAFLADEILRSGNFGHGDDRYSYNASDGMFKRFCQRMGRLVHYWSIAPTEVLWAPYFKIRQWIWRKINRY